MSTIEPLNEVRVLVTAGPTREALDPVRYLSNRSSGKMGFAVARAARDAGARVTLVSGPVTRKTPRGVWRVNVESADDMHGAVQEYLPDTDIFISVAAVADYRPEDIAANKIKKAGETMQLNLIRNPDILAQVAASENAPFTVGFAAETENVIENARAKLFHKNVDMIAANRVGADQAFDQDTNALTVLWSDGELDLPPQAKPELAKALVECIARQFRANRIKGGRG